MAANSDKNLFFSPLSISTALAMVFLGARGQTAKELRDVLWFEKAGLPDAHVHQAYNYFAENVLKSKDSNAGYVLDSANAVLVQKALELLPEYKYQVQKLYKASVKDVDFQQNSAQVVSEINQWVQQKTNGKIEKLVDQLDASTLMVLLNAVYFKGTWKTQFEKSRTRLQTFYNRGLESGAKNVPMMQMTSDFPYYEDNTLQLLELPYKGGNLSMVVLLPKSKRSGLYSIERNLSPKSLDEMISRVRVQEVKVTLPKFKVEFEDELSGKLKEMGARSAFGRADFSGMVRSGGVKIDQVLHKAVVEVNEEGSEAAAVTGVIMVKAALIDRPVVRADHPFLFAIIEKSSRMILFMGRVNAL